MVTMIEELTQENWRSSILQVLRKHITAEETLPYACEPI